MGDDKLQRTLLLSTVFITGACVLVIELVGTRALAPFYGSGVYTWSALISVTLLALSVGYYLGGRLADRFPRNVVVYYLIFGASLWTLITPSLAINLLPGLASNTDMRVGILIASLLLFTPNLVLLGAMSPYCIRLLSISHSIVGSVSGVVFAVSTIGSLIGAVMTGFYIIPNFGVRSVFTTTGSVLLLLSLFGALAVHRIENRKLILSLLITVAAYTTTMGSKPPTDLNIIDQQPSFYGNVQAVEKDDIRILLVDGIGQNYVSNNTEYTTPYINFMSAIPGLRDRQQDDTSALVIGLGAGELSNLLIDDGIDTDAVEISPTVASFAREYFGSTIDDDHLHLMDGRVYIANTDREYDYIFFDAFSSEQIAWHLVTREAFTEAGSRLRPGGLLMMNLTSSLDNQDVRSIQSTLKSVFPHVHTYALPSEYALTSIVYLASDEPIELSTDYSSLRPLTALYMNRFMTNELPEYESAAIYTDDYNPIGDQRHNVHSLWRERMREFFTEEETLWLMI